MASEPTVVAKPAPGGQVPADGLDPNIRMPPNVMAASKIAMEAHQRAYANAPSTERPQDLPPAPEQGPEAPVPTGQVPAQGGELPEVNADGSPNWENRWKALKGRYDADSRRWNETQEQFEQRTSDLTRENASLKRPPLPGIEPPPVMVTQKDIDDYGEDMIDVVKRAAVEAILPLLKPLATSVGQVQARVDTTESETAKQFVSRMHNTMDSSVPGWQSLNGDPNFIAWAKQNDVYSGLNRREMLQKAWYAGDSNRVAAFFNGYLAEEAALNPAAAQARQQAQANGQGGHVPAGGPASSPNAAPGAHQGGRVTLEQLAAPGRARAAAQAPAGTKPTWTAAGISQFYMDVAAGKFRGREQERIATEADLMAAQREGRIEVNPRTATNLGS